MKRKIAEVYMKKYHCPDCGEQQKQEIDWPSKIKVKCPVCESSLLVKFDNTGLAVKVINPKLSETAEAVL